MDWMRSLALATLVVALVAPVSALAGEPATLFVVEDGLALLLRPDVGSAPLPGDPLPKGTAVTVVEEQAPFWVRVRPPQGLPGWSMQFSLTSSAPAKERETSRGSHRLFRQDSADMTSTAGSLGLGEFMAMLEESGDLQPKDIELVRKITEFQPSTDVQAFLKEGRLGRYMLATE